MTCSVLCNASPEVKDILAQCSNDGMGYHRTYEVLRSYGYNFPRSAVQNHWSNCTERNVLTAIGEAEDQGVEVDNIRDYFETRGIDVPPEGLDIVAATIEERGPDGQKHWARIKPTVESERSEIRQAQPVNLVTPPFATFSELRRSNWQIWICTPDAQIGYWRDYKDNFHSIHDERCFDLAFQVASAVAEDEGLHGWLDVGDFADLAAPSRHHPTRIDLDVHCLNKTWQRGCEELARRRSVVGPEGELVILSGNHDIRLEKKAAQEASYLVGMRRAGDPDDEHPVLTVPYLMRAKDYGVEWVPSFPTGYRRLNSNLVAFHSPAYGSKALDTARKIAHKIHASVVFGHTHRRESLAENIETSKGNRTMEIWSDGTFARIDGSLPSQRNTFDTCGDRLIVSELPENMGMLSEAMHQGLSIVHVEVDGRERFSVERVAIWDGWLQCRGQIFESTCDAEGKTNEDSTG